MTEARMAQEVVINPDEHTFTVDGEEFPWYISQLGPAVSRFADDLYAVHVDIFAHQGFDNQMSPTGPNFAQPVIGGRAFPWFIAREGIDYIHRGGQLPFVKLAFLARSVVGVEADDMDTDDVWDFSGAPWKSPAVDT